MKKQDGMISRWSKWEGKGVGVRVGVRVGERERESDEQIAPIGAGCRAARKAGGQLKKAIPMRFKKIINLDTYHTHALCITICYNQNHSPIFAL
jgi:hypothetical protein